MIRETVQLPIGLELDGVLQRDLIMREATVKDMLEAEDQVPVEKSMAFNLAQAGLQIESVGSIKGPFTLAELVRWNKHDVDAVMRCWGDVEKKSLAAVIKKNLAASASAENSGSLAP